MQPLPYAAWLANTVQMPLPFGRPGAMLLSPSTFRREVRRCFSHFAAVALFRVWTMEPHRRTSLRRSHKICQALHKEGEKALESREKGCPFRT
jgi:hypothetical protein